MENVAVVQPTPHLKSKDLSIRKNIQKPAQSPTRGANTESKCHSLNYNLYFINIYIFMEQTIKKFFVLR